ncbi:MAG: ABC transporter substrate-binding protein [Armatimonas sp.]
MTRRVFGLLGLLLLAGCPSGSGPSGTASPSAGGKETVRVAFFPNVTHAVALYGSGSGLFAKSLGEATVEEKVFKAGPEEIEALFAGEVDLGYIGPGPAINGFLKSNGKALKIVAGAASGGAALVARSDVAIASIKDLAGKKVAVPQTGGTQDIALRHALKTAGITNAQILQYAPADSLREFQNKTIDAAWLPEPWVARLEAEAGAKLVVDERTLWPDGKFSSAVLIARTEFLEKHPDLVKKFVAANEAAVAAIEKDPEAARKAIGERLKTLQQGKAVPDAILKKALERTQVTSDPLKDSILTVADHSKELGYLKQGREALGPLFATEPGK